MTSPKANRPPQPQGSREATSPLPFPPSAWVGTTRPRMLLHTCCGVCASHCVRVLKNDGWEPVLFFSDFNLWPHEEYLRRRVAAQRLATAEAIDFVEDPPDHAQWKAEVAAGYEGCTEGGARCARCFRFSLQRAEAALARLGCSAFTTSLTVSPHKRSALLHAIGREVGGDRFIPYDFKKQGGFQASNRRAAELGLYRQIYCGCEFSVRHREPFTAIILGMGYRGRIYAQWALEHPDDLRVVAIAEPDPTLRAAWAERLALPSGHAFADWPDALMVSAECAIVALPDRLHFHAAQVSLAHGLHTLLEKPVGATWEECVALDATVRECGRMVQVAHILRFTPYYAKIADLIRGGALGELVSIRHLEPVGYGKAAQAFCRGPFGNTQRSSPMILQKCSHDFDLFSWWVGRRCLSAQSFGGLRHFRPECAPPGAATRCVDCPKAVERTCPHSAIRLLLDRADLRYALPDTSPAGIETALQGPLGRCVYACDNDAVDHQVVNLLFEGGVTVSHAMESHTWARDRQTHIFLTDGEIVGDARTLRIHRFSDRATWLWDAALEGGSPTHESSYILGNDGLLEDWLTALRTLPPARYAERFHASLQSHAIAFAAEASRLAGGHPIPIAAL